jgi:uncharacterized protein (TIGR03083 family)
VDHEQLLAVTRDESTRLAATYRGAEPGVPVASCPGWTLAKLVKHTGSAQAWARTIAERQTTEMVDPRSVDLGLPDDEAAYGDWFEAGAQRLVDALHALDPDVPLWSWAGDDRAGFWSRRMAHETAVHRWDAQQAAGNGVEPIDAPLAVDGIDERFDNLPATAARAGVTPTGNGETVHLHATDAEGEWLVRMTPDGVDVSHGHAKGDVAARGSASDLLLVVYGRLPVDTVNVFGDAALLARFQELMKL